MSSRHTSWTLFGFALLTSLTTHLYAEWGQARSDAMYQHIPHDADASYVGIALMGLLAGALLFVASVFPAITSYRHLVPPRPVRRLLELVAFAVFAIAGIAVLLEFARAWY